MLLEQPLRVPSEFEQPYAFFKVGLIGGLVPFNLAQATILLGAPLSRHPFEKCAVYLSVKLIHVHGVHAGLKPIVFGPQPSYGRFILALLVGVAGVERIADPGKHFVVECQPTKEV